MRFAVLCLYLLLAVFTLNSTAQPPEIFQTSVSDRFLNSVYTTKNGLPQNSSTAIVQTKDGYLWIATFGGLARFDGIKFKVFTTSNTPELVTNRWTALFEDRRGVLWIGSEYGDLLKYENGLFSLVKKSAGEPTDSTINALYLDDKDVLWIGGYGSLKTFDVRSGKFQAFTRETLFHRTPLDPEGFGIHNITQDSRGNLWFSTNNGLICFGEGQFKDFNTSDGLPTDSIISVKADSQNNLFVLTKHGFGKFDGKTFTSLHKTFVKGDYVPEVSPLIRSEEDNIYFVAGKTLFKVTGSGIEEFDMSALIHSAVSSIVKDREDNLWLGTNDELIELKPRNIRVFAYKNGNQLLPVNSIIEDKSGSVWAASANNLLHWQNGKFDFLKNSGYFLRNFISTLAVDENNTLWLGTISGIKVLKGDEIIPFPDKSLFSREIGTIVFDRQNNMWIGSKVEGVQKYSNGTIETFTTKDGLIDNSIVCIFEDRNRVIWIGTRRGLSRYENGAFTNFTVENGLSNNSIRDIYEDFDGTLWIGTYGGGIIRYREGKFTTISSKNGLAEDIASRILVDAYDNFWILGNQGIYKVSRSSLNDFADGNIKTVYCVVYNEKDGMEVGEGNGGNQPAGWKTSDGKLWFPMIRGGIIIDPVETKIVPPPVYIEEASLNRAKIETVGKLQIEPGQSNLEINYTAIKFNKPEQIQFRYKLEGFDDDWQDVGNRRTAYYPYLPPGTYKFSVMATSGNGVWSNNDASLEIVVNAPFWRTLWFYALLFLSVIALIVVAYQLRLRSLVRKRVRQQEFSRQLINAHESERFRIAAELHDSLGQELLIIKNWALLGLNKLKANSDVTKQLEVISETASNALEETRAISHNLRPNHLQRFGLSNTLENMAKQIEESSHIEFDIKVENIDDLFSPQSELSIYRIVQESLTNIVKHSKAQKASLKILNLSDRVEITIQDEGIGFLTQSYLGSGEANIGFGLDNIIQRTGILGGKHSIQSSLRKGTKIIITLPIINNYDEN